MKKYSALILVIIVIQLLVCAGTSPAYAYDFPIPPLNPDNSWQPPYGGGFIDPPADVQIYNQTWSDLQIPPPSPVAAGTPGTLIDAYLVNSSGRILTDLYRNEPCYLIVSLNGPGFFYLWEYYPSGTTSYGHWLSYRWYRPSAGIWRIGPFAAESLDPAGQYTWKMWFLSGYTWSQRSLSFNYIRSYYPPDIPVLTPAPVYPPVINSFSSDKASIGMGETAVLHWTTSNAVSVTISPNIGTVGASGSTSVTPTGTTTYTISAKGRSGDQVSRTTTVTVKPRALPGMSIGQATIRRGQSTYISWDAPGAAKVAITGIGAVDSKGSTNISPEKTTTYTLTATYIDGTSQSTSVTASVEQPNYLLWILIFILVVAVIAILFFIFKRPRKAYQAVAAVMPAARTTPAAETHPTDILPATEPVLDFASARLEIADGKDILLTHKARSLGRHDFEEFLPVENATYISRQHVNIWYEDSNYYIEDRSSTNGTRLNDVDIKGSGRHELVDGDVIELAGKLRITFKKNIDKEEQEI